MTAPLVLMQARLPDHFLAGGLLGDLRGALRTCLCACTAFPSGCSDCVPDWVPLCVTAWTAS